MTQKNGAWDAPYAGYVADTFANHLVNASVLFGGEGRNHSSVADGGVAERVFE